MNTIFSAGVLIQYVSYNMLSQDEKNMLYNYDVDLDDWNYAILVKKEDFEKFRRVQDLIETGWAKHKWYELGLYMLGVQYHA